MRDTREYKLFNKYNLKIEIIEFSRPVLFMLLALWVEIFDPLEASPLYAGMQVFSKDVWFCIFLLAAVFKAVSALLHKERLRKTAIVLGGVIWSLILGLTVSVSVRTLIVPIALFFIYLACLMYWRLAEGEEDVE